MFLSLMTIAFSSLLLLLVPFALLAIYIVACLILRRQVSNPLLSGTALLTLIVAALHFSVTYLLPIVGPAPLLYIGVIALVLGGSLVDWPALAIKDGARRCMEWMRATGIDVIGVQSKT